MVKKKNKLIDGEKKAWVIKEKLKIVPQKNKIDNISSKLDVFHREKCKYVPYLFNIT